MVNARKARGWAKDVVKRAKAKVKLVRDHPILAQNQAVLDMQGEIVARLQSTHVMMENVERLMVVGHDRFRFIANGLGRWCKAHPDMCDRVIGTLSVTIGIYAGGVAFSAAAAAAAEAAAAAAAAQAAAAAAVASGSAAAAELTAAAAAAEAAATAAAGVLATVVIPVLIGVTFTGLAVYVFFWLRKRATEETDYRQQKALESLAEEIQRLIGEEQTRVAPNALMHDEVDGEDDPMNFEIAAGLTLEHELQRSAAAVKAARALKHKLRSEAGTACFFCFEELNVENELAEPVYRYPLCAAACGVRLCRMCHDAHPGLRDTCPQCGIANPGGVMSLV